MIAEGEINPPHNGKTSFTDVASLALAFAMTSQQLTGAWQDCIVPDTEILGRSRQSLELKLSLRERKLTY